jgi:hypothetical protein
MEATTHTPSSDIIDTARRRDDTDNDNDNDEDTDDAIDHNETHLASPSDQTLLTQEFASPASAVSVSSAATRSSTRRRTSRNGNNDNGSANGNTASSPQCLTQDPETIRQDQAEDNQDDQASPSARINNDDNDDNDVDNNDGANSATSSDDYDDNDDEDSSEEEDDDDENEMNPNALAMMARRESNIRRNKAFMDSLDLAQGITPKPDKSNTTLDNGEDDPEEPPKRRGMLLSTTTTSAATVVVGDDSNANTNTSANDDHNLDGLASLQSMFCHRHAPIRKLYSVLAAAASQSQSQSQSGAQYSSRSRLETTSRFIPAPIIVTGSSGSGKTAILRATVQAIENGNRVPAAKGKVKDGDDDGTQVVSAYINCATLDVASIDELVTHAHSQFQASIQKLSGIATVRKKNRSKRRKKKRKKSSATTDQAGKE